MKDQELRDLFDRLPHHRARPGFSARVRRRIEAKGQGEGRSRSLLPPILLPAAAALVLMAALVAWWTLGGASIPVSGPVEKVLIGQSSQPHQEARERLERLKLERTLARRQLARVRALLAEASPVVYLGGTEEFDLILDLGEGRSSSPAPDTGPTG